MLQKISGIFFLAIILFLGSCQYPEKIKDGKTAYERKRYYDATKMLSNEFERTTKKEEQAVIAYQIGDSYAQIHNSEKAEEWFAKAYDLDYGADAMKGYAFALKENEKYKEAIIAFRDLGVEIGSPYEYRREITACKESATWKTQKKTNPYKVIPPKFNSSSFDYAAMPYKDNMLVFTSDRSAAKGEMKYGWTGKKYSDFFIVPNKGGKVEPFEAFNTDFNEGTITFNSDFTLAVYSQCGTNRKASVEKCRLLYSSFKNGFWSSPKEVEFTNENVNYGTPSLSPDGFVLHFASDDEEGWGGLDLYMSTMDGEQWTTPKNLGTRINTSGNEAYPFVDADSLYFSSDFHIGMGGYDIFKSIRFNGKWTTLQNLKPPINSGSDDFAFVLDRKSLKKKGIEQIGFFTSNRAGGEGRDDIYRFYRKPVPPPPPPPPTSDTTIVEKPKEIIYSNILEVVVLEKIYAISGNPNSKILGRKPLVGANLQINGEGIKEKLTLKTGIHELNLEDGISYNFFAGKEGYFNNTGNFSAVDFPKDPNNPIQRYTLEIVVDKVFKNVEIVLENIYYDFNKWDIRPDAEPTLKNLAGILNRNPQINKIQLSSHTDCRGGDGLNLTLSQKRAQSAVDYLIQLGIAKDRLVAQGYGEKQPAVDCICDRCSEEEHQVNRRTTFSILD